MANIGFISTRFAGNDGVSLESAKWARVFGEMGHTNHWYSGLSDRDRGFSKVIPEAHFGHAENVWINERIWRANRRDRLVTRRIQHVVGYLKDTLYDFVRDSEIELLILENSLTIPMHVPLGIAITEFIAETCMPSIAHHHDFFWERSRFAVNAVPDYLDMSFPPRMANLSHTVINREAQAQLSHRKGLSSFLVPNVFDFETPPPEPDDYSRDFREQLGFTSDDIIFLQPTRIVPRKGIEHAIRLVARLNDPRIKLVISHDAGDEGFEYHDFLLEIAGHEGVDMRIIADRVSEKRQLNSKGQKMYTLWDIYPHADFVTYPSTYEGFGNAFLEAVYFKKPVLINRYSIYITDIEPFGFRVVPMDGYITNATVKSVRHCLQNPAYARQMTEHNYEIAARLFSMPNLREQLTHLTHSILKQNH